MYFDKEKLLRDTSADAIRLFEQVKNQKLSPECLKLIVDSFAHADKGSLRRAGFVDSDC